MNKALEHLYTDEHKIKLFKISLGNVINELQSVSGRVHYNTDDLRHLEEPLNQLLVIHAGLNKKSTINGVVLKLIEVERTAIRRITQPICMYLDRLLVFILNEKINLLMDTGDMIDSIAKLIESTESKGGSLKVAGEIVLYELTDVKQKYKPLKDRLEDALFNISRYSSSLETIKSFTQGVYEYPATSEVELRNFEKELKGILEDNYNF